MMLISTGLHRFLPALMRREGYDIAYVDVIDRPRHSGVSNTVSSIGYGSGSWILPGVVADPPQEADAGRDRGIFQ